jgi:hypothetical protein
MHVTSFRNLEVVVLELDILMLDVLRQHFIRHVPRRGSEIPSSPQMSAPELLVQPPVVSKKVVGSLPLDHMHHFARRQVRRNIEKQVDVVRSHMPLQDQDVVASAYLPDQFTQPLADLPAKDRLAVLRDEDEMVVKSSDCMGKAAVVQHASLYRKPPKGFALKARVSDPPRRRQ